MITARPTLDFRETWKRWCRLFLMILLVEELRAQVIQDSRCYLESGGSVESFFVSEDAPVGFVVGILGIHGDPHEQHGNIALSLKEADSPVRIAPGSKNLTLARPLDKEGVLGPSSVYVNVICDRKRTNDPGFVIPVSIRVTDANDNAPEWIGAPYRLRLAEVTAPGTRALQAARARDRDQHGPFSTVEYRVLPGPHAEYFSFVNSLEGTLVLRRALDYETLPNFTLALRAQDQGTPPRHSDTLLHVEVQDSDDQNPKFLDEGYTALLPERVTKGSQVMISPREIMAADQDTGINAPLFYSFNIDHPSFVIDRDTARVTVARDIGEEDLQMPATLVVRATQYDNPDRYALATLTVSKQSVGKQGLHFTSRHYYATVLENLPVSSVLMTLTTNRPRDRSLKYFVSDRRFLTKFAINTAGEVVLKKSLDYEEDDKYTFQVMVTDGTANDTATINITVLNVNDWDPRFRYPQYEFFLGASRPTSVPGVPQDSSLGPLFVGEIEAADGDRGDKVQLGLKGADSSLFYITDKGEIFLRENALALVNSSMVHVVATATDSGTPPRQTSVPIIVHFSEALMASTNVASLHSGSLLLIIAFGTVLGLLAVVIIILLGYIYKVKRPKSTLGNKVAAAGNGVNGSGGSIGGTNGTNTGFIQHEKLHNVTGTALGAASSGSLLSVSAGASTILANSTSSLNVNQQDNLDNNAGGIPRGSHRFLSPRPPGALGTGISGNAALMSNHLATQSGGRSGVAWPAQTIPARVKKLSWDDDEHKGENGSADNLAEQNNIQSPDHLNLTVYF